MRIRALLIPLLATLFAALPFTVAFAVDLTITASGVVYVSGPKDGDQQAGEAFAAGAMVYLSATGTWLKAQDDGTAVEAGQNGIGMALSTADAANARVSIARPGAIVTIGTGTAGVIYTLSDNAGGLAPSADNGSADKITPAALGIGTSQVLLIYGYNAGAVK